MNSPETPAFSGPTAPDWDVVRACLAGGTLSIVMPCHNLAATVATNIVQVAAFFASRLPCEIVPVDDGSTDETRREIEHTAARLGNVRPVYLGRNMGKGEALRRGFAASTGNYVLLLDGDLDLAPDHVPGLFRALVVDGADVAIGSKHHPDSHIHAYPWHRKIPSTVYYLLIKHLFGMPLRDTQTGIKLFKREVLAWAFPRMVVRQFAFDLELLAMVNARGYRIAEAPVRLKPGGRWNMVRPRAVRQIVIDTLAIFYRLRILRYYDSIPDLAMPQPPPSVSIVIAYPAPSAYLAECLDGIARQDYPYYEVILLPDAPSGRTWPAGVREVPTGRIRPAEKRNLGIREARGGIVAFIDDDAFPDETWLRHAVAQFAQPDVAAVGGPGVTPPHDPHLAQLSGRVFSHPLVSGGYRYRYVPGRIQDVEDFPSCNLFVRTDVLRRIGGFRTDFWPGEDTYLCLQIVKEQRLRIVYDSRVHVFHHRRGLFLPHLRQVGRYALHRGYFARHFPATSRRIGYMMPSLFVIGLVAGAPVAALVPPLRWLYGGAVAFYLVLTFLSAVSLNPLNWLLVWLGIVTTHLVYGARFLVGLVVKRLPETVQRFDHPSEAAPAAGATP